MTGFRQRLQDAATGAGPDSAPAAQALQVALEWNAALVNGLVGQTPLTNAERLQRVAMLAGLANALQAAQPLFDRLGDPALRQALGLGAALRGALDSGQATLTTIRDRLAQLDHQMRELEQEELQVAALRDRLAVTEAEYQRRRGVLDAQGLELRQRDALRAQLEEDEREIKRLETLDAEQLRQHADELAARRKAVEPVAQAEGRLSDVVGPLLALEQAWLARLQARLRDNLAAIAAADSQLAATQRELTDAEHRLRDLQARFAHASELQQERVEPLRLYAKANAQVAERLLRPDEDPQAWLDQAQELLNRVDAALRAVLDANQKAQLVKPLH